jgi:hypothetical protein
MLIGSRVTTFVVYYMITWDNLVAHRLHTTKNRRKLPSRLLSESVSLSTLEDCKYPFNTSYKITKYPEINSLIYP